MQQDNILDVSRRLSAALRPGDLDQTLSRITATAVEVLPDVAHCSITVKHADGRLETAAPTHDFLCELDAAQYELREGPCYEAAVETAHVVAPDLSSDTRFPRYGEIAVSRGIRAQMGLRLFENARSQGALNLYSHRVGAFVDIEALGELFAHQSATAIAYAHEVNDLRAALQSRKIIGQAIGILMERYQLNDQRAFAFLSRLSQARNVKLRAVAQEVVDAADRQETSPPRA